MDIRRILLTGDDGYNAIGTRLLVHFLKHEYQLFIAGTKNQQSGVGGTKTLKKELAWGEDTVDGVRAVWIDGTPVDSIECAKEYYKQSFDLVLSGINLGLNVSGSLISSGTFSAAFHAINLGIAPRAIAMSLEVPANNFRKKHKKSEDIRMFYEYPGRQAYAVFKKALQHDMWGGSILNINFPIKRTGDVVFTDCMETMYGLWPVSVLDKKTHTYVSPMQTPTKEIASVDTDVSAIEEGKISITPCQSTMLDAGVYDRIKRVKFSLG